MAFFSSTGDPVDCDLISSSSLDQQQQTGSAPPTWTIATKSVLTHLSKSLASLLVVEGTTATLQSTERKRERRERERKRERRERKRERRGEEREREGQL